MAVTSNWEWVAQERRSDVNIGQNNVRLTRQNWSLQRSRISNESNASQLGEHAETLSAFAGGTYLTVSPDASTLDFLYFGTTRNWTDTSYKYLVNYTTSWVGAGGISKSPYVIGSNYANKPTNGKITVIKPILTYPAGGWQWAWEAGEWDAGSTAWITTYTNISSAQFAATGGSKYPILASIAVYPSAEPATYNFKWSSTDGTLAYIYKNGQKVQEVPHSGGYSSYTSFIVPNAFSASLKTNGSINFPEVDTTSWYEFVVVNRLPVDSTPTNRIRTAAVLSGDRSASIPDCPSCNGVSFSTAAGTFSGASTATLNREGGGVFYCASDIKEFQNGVDWYRQTQQWIYRDGWS
jgi:hypothetical protein